MSLLQFQNTSKPGIYALGDVCGKALLTPGMSHAEHSKSENILRVNAERAFAKIADNPVR